jgi:hypothetical protein
MTKQTKSKRQQLNVRRRLNRVPTKMSLTCGHRLWEYSSSLTHIKSMVNFVNLGFIGNYEIAGDPTWTRIGTIFVGSGLRESLSWWLD